mgnify:CR=1 FL=1
MEGSIGIRKNNQNPTGSHSSLNSDRITLYNEDGARVFDFSSAAVAVNDEFATITSPYNNKGLHMQRTIDNKILFIIDNLPKSDPGINGALYSD